MVGIADLDRMVDVSPTEFLGEGDINGLCSRGIHVPSCMVGVSPTEFLDDEGDINGLCSRGIHVPSGMVGVPTTDLLDDESDVNGGLNWDTHVESTIDVPDDAVAVLSGNLGGGTGRSISSSDDSG